MWVFIHWSFHPWSPAFSFCENCMISSCITCEYLLLWNMNINHVGVLSSIEWLCMNVYFKLIPWIDFVYWDYACFELLNYELLWAFMMDFKVPYMRVLLHIGWLICIEFTHLISLLNCMILNKYHEPTICLIKLHDKNSQVVDELLHDLQVKLFCDD